MIRTEGPMPSMPRSPDDVVARFAAVMDRFPDVERRKMFGYPAAFVGGNMATGLHGTSWVVRLAEPEGDSLIAAGGAPFEPMPGRRMAGFVVLPAAIVEDDGAIGVWIERAIAHAASMPAKHPKGR
jgi:hypothetical protein